MYSHLGIYVETNHLGEEKTGSQVLGGITFLLSFRGGISCKADAAFETKTTPKTCVCSTVCSV